MALIACTGCMTPNPASLAVTDRDKAVYQDQGAAKQEDEGKARVAIIVSQGDYKNAGEAAKALDSTLTSLISDFAFFEVAERANLGALMQEGALKALDEDGDALPAIPGADFLITATMNTFQMIERPKGLSDTLIATDKKTVVDVVISVDFRFYETDGKRVILTRNIERKYPCADMSSAKSKVAVAAQECAKAFAMELGSRYAPPARVVETRGGGEVARISMGSNYGLAKGVKVEFFEYVDNSDIIEGATREPSIVAKGTTIESDVKSAWVEIDDHKKANVKRGHYVRIRSDQSKGFRDNLRLN